MNIISRLGFFACAILFVTAFSSCSSKGDDPAADDHQLIVSFTSAGVPIATTDSMISLFISGTDTLRKKAIRGGTFYSISLSGLPNTSYKTVNKVYTAPDSSGQQYMYRYEVSVNTSANANLIGPTGNGFDLWKPNLFFHNDEYNIKFAIAVLPADPYYELTLPQSLPFKNVYIERNAYATLNKVKYAIKHANSIFKAVDYKGFHSNITAFATFAAQSAGTTYSSADVSLQLYNEVNNDYKIIFQQQVPFSN